MRIFALSVLISANLLAGDPPCPSIDKSKLDSDGMPFCPSIVAETSAYGVFRCALEQANSFHTPTEIEKKNMATLLGAWKDATDKGISKATTTTLLAAADDLGLQACRVAKDPDSYLLVYTKPGVKNYSGPLLMLRETKASKVMIIGPHDDSDGTYADTKLALQKTSARAVISNGHKRGNVGKDRGDFVHETDNLGYVAVAQIARLFPSSVFLHIHGMKNPDHVLVRSRSKQLQVAYQRAIVNATNIKSDAFAPLNADFSVDKVVNTNWYLKTEIPARIHSANKMGLANVVKELETYEWAWPDSKLEPVVLDHVDDGDDDKPVDLTAETVETVPELDLELPAIPAGTAADSLVYAPYPKGNRGTKTLACVAVNYTNPINDYMTAERCLKVAKRTADFYEKNSNGRLKLDPKGYQMKFEGDGWKVFSQAEEAAKKQFKADYYIIPNIFRKGGNHASGKIAHVCQLTGWVIDHEVGHLLGMGHSGKYIYDKDGKPSLQAYGDEQSPMGNNGYRYLVAPQYYALGWLGKEGTALYKEPATFEVTRITADKKDGVLFGVLVKAENFFGKNLPAIKEKHRDAFIAFPSECPGDAKACVGLYLFQGGGPQRVKLANDLLVDEIFTGLTIKVLGAANNKVKFSVDFGSAPKK